MKQMMVKRSVHKKKEYNPHKQPFQTFHFGLLCEADIFDKSLRKLFRFRILCVTVAETFECVHRNACSFYGEMQNWNMDEKQ